MKSQNIIKTASICVHHRFGGTRGFSQLDQRQLGDPGQGRDCQDQQMRRDGLRPYSQISGHASKWGEPEGHQQPQQEAAQPQVAGHGCAYRIQARRQQMARPDL